MARLGFPRAKHLRKTDEISSVFSFNRRFSSEHFEVLVKPRQQGWARMGVIVAKRTARLATERNYIKRVGREIFRHRQHSLRNLDIIVRVRKKFTKLEYAAVAVELDKVLQRVQKTFYTVTRLSKA